MPINSNSKGKRYEREIAKYLRDNGYLKARRSQQYCGDSGDCDVVGLPGIHIEAKCVEKFNLYKAMEQAKSDAKDHNVPTVWHRRNNKKTVVIMDIDDWLNLYDSSILF